MRHLFFFNVILILLFTFCVKKNDPPRGFSCDQITKTNITDPQLLMCKYKANSWWVFLDTINKTYDTLKVVGIKSYFGFDLFMNADCDSMEHQNIFFQNTDLKYNWSGLFYLDVITYRVYILGGLGANTAKCVFAPNKINSMDFKFITHDSLFIANRFYKNVCEWDTIAPTRDVKFQINTGKMKHYFNPEYGFLRTDIFDSKNKLVSRKLLVSSNLVR